MRPSPDPVAADRHGRAAASSRTRPAAARGVRAALAVACCALFVCGATLAQSGRRQQKPAEIAPVPTPTPEPTPIPRAETEVEDIGLLLLSGDDHAFSAMGNYSYLMRDVISQRLREAKSFDITGDAKSATRGEANKRAKQEKKRHVVWFQLVTPGQFGEPPMIGQSRRDVQVEFVILEPETGKQKAGGRAYPGGRRTGGIGGIGLPGCYPRGTTTDTYELVEAAMEAADRVIRHFNVTVPPRCS